MSESLAMVETNLDEASTLIFKMLKKDPHLPYMLWGKAGVGKSALGRFIAKELDYEHIDIRLPQFDPTDIKGLPVPDLQKMVVKWIIPDFLPTNSKCLIMLDEIAAAPKMVQVAAYQLVLDRQLGDYKLPDGVIILAASNPEGAGVCQGMPLPLINRFASHLYIKPDVEIWKKWAIQSKIDPRIIGFLNQHSAFLHTDSAKDGNVAFASPRSWEMLSTQISGETKLESIFKIIYGCIGSTASQMFLGFAEHQHDMPDVNDILAGKDFKYPNKPETMYLTIAALISKAYEKDTTKAIQQVLKFAINMPQSFAEYGVTTAKDIFSVYGEEFYNKIEDTPEIDLFIERYSKYLL